MDPPARQPADDRRCATWRSRSARTISCSATFGRGFYVLDDYSPLRQLSQATFDRDGHVFPDKPAVIEVPETGKARGSQGEQL